MIIKRKKNTRQRGSKTHGYGAMKKHRGAGHRGGRGNAGTGKRGDAKKPSVWAKKKFYGKHGFKRPQKIIKDINAVNISFIESKFQLLLEKGIISEKQGSFFIDLSKINVHKLLAKGSPTRSYNITVDYASARAVEKIKSAKGNVILAMADNASDSADNNAETTSTEDNNTDNTADNPKA